MRLGVRKLAFPLMNPDLQQLLQSGSPASRTALYLRLLYSPSCARAVQALPGGGEWCDPQALAFVKSIDFVRLGLERNARLRNLAHHLGEAFPCSWLLLDADLRRDLVERFVETPSFWRFPGRSLPESFALAAWQILRERQLSFLADIVRLEGVLSGFATAPAKAAPWQDLAGADHRCIAVADGGPAERFPSQWQLLDDDSQLPTPTSAAELMARAPAPHHISLTLDPDGSIEIACARLAT
jgi:hypothetical protein